MILKLLIPFIYWLDHRSLFFQRKFVRRKNKQKNIWKFSIKFLRLLIIKIDFLRLT